MGIWEILGIAPTTNIRQIKKAYAAKSREVHPEEKPEEFRMLHEAYQKALQYAKKAGQPNPVKEESPVPPDRTEDQTPGNRTESAERSEKGTAEEDILRSYFEKQSDEWEEKLAVFFDHWKEVKFEYRNPEIQKWWTDYLKSKDFQDIQWHPKLLQVLGEEMDQKLHYDYMIRLLFWEAYHFHSSDAEGYLCQEDLLKLRRGLYPAYERRQQEEAQKRLDEEKRRIEERRAGIRKRISLVLIVILTVTAPVFLYFILTKDARYVKTYMEQRYPETEFSRPKKIKTSDYNICYEVHSLAHPDISATVLFRYSLKGNVYGERDDYGLQLLEYYAEQYGLHYGRLEEGFDYCWSYKLGEEISLLYYSDEETLSEFCETVVRMFQEQKELQQLEAVGICKEGALYPDILVNGKMEGFKMTDEQFYRPWEMDAAVLERSVLNSYMRYMFHFESWNLTPKQYLEWGPDYENACRELEMSSREGEYSLGYWYDLYQEEREEPVCKLYLPVYIENKASDGIAYTKMMPVGDIYHYLLAEGTPITASEDGSGFFAEINGQSRFFGEKPAERLKEVEQWILPKSPVFLNDPKQIEQLLEQYEKSRG